MVQNLIHIRYLFPLRKTIDAMRLLYLFCLLATLATAVLGARVDGITTVQTVGVVQLDGFVAAEHLKHRTFAPAVAESFHHLLGQPPEVLGVIQRVVRVPEAGHAKVLHQSVLFGAGK